MHLLCFHSYRALPVTRTHSIANISIQDHAIDHGLQAPPATPVLQLSSSLIPSPSTGNVLTSFPTSTSVDSALAAPSESTSISAFFPLGSSTPHSFVPTGDVIHKRDPEVEALNLLRYVSSVAFILPGILELSRGSIDSISRYSARADVEGATKRELLEAIHH